MGHAHNYKDIFVSSISSVYHLLCDALFDNDAIGSDTFIGLYIV